MGHPSVRARDGYRQLGSWIDSTSPFDRVRCVHGVPGGDAARPGPSPQKVARGEVDQRVGIPTPLGLGGRWGRACVHRGWVEYGVVPHRLGGRSTVVLGRRMERELRAGAKVLGAAI